VDFGRFMVINVPIETAILIGFVNDMQDDFTLPNGTVVSLDPAKDADVFHKFGQHWQANELSSVFVYDMGLSQQSFVNLNYLPKFMQDRVNFSNSSLGSIAREKCANNTKCLYDISVTNDVEIGLLTLNFDKKVQNFNEEIQKIQLINIETINHASLVHANSLFFALAIGLALAYIINI
jgi:hypothetical protein